MIPLVLLPFIFVYVFLLFYVPDRFSKFAKARNFSMAKRWGLTLFGFLLVYLPVFWDHIPTVVAHNYYCGKDAGLFIYKTSEQWKIENPGVAETLTYSDRGVSKWEKIADGQRYLLNQRFAREVHRNDAKFGIRRSEDAIVDVTNGSVMAIYRSYSTGIVGNLVGGSGGIRSLKHWMAYSTCEADEEERPNSATFDNLETEFMKIGMKEIGTQR